MTWLLLTIIAFQLLLYGNKIERQRKAIAYYEADLEFFGNAAQELQKQNKRLMARIKELEEENK